MGWVWAAKFFFAFILLGFGLYGTFVVGQRHPLLTQAGASSASVNEAPDIRLMKRRFHNKTADGQFGTNCDPCFVPFIRLIAQPEKYHNRQITTVGFLKRLYGSGLRLYPTEGNAKTFGLLEYVEIYNTRPKNSPALLIPLDLEPKLKEGTWVRVSGRFDASYTGMSLGALYGGHDIGEFLDLSPPPDQPPNIALQKIVPVRPGIPQIEVAPSTH